MRISIVMPTLNEDRKIADALSQVLALPVHEVIVVDGGSHDATRAILESFRGGSPAAPADTQRARPPLTVLLTRPGRARQMNAGAAASDGDALLFLHADTRLPPGACEAIGAAFLDPACVGGRFDVRFEPDTRWGRVIAGMMNVRSRWTGIATGDQAMFVARDAFHRLGGFADLPLMEDIDLSRRLKRAGRLAALRLTVTTSYRRWQQQGPLRTILLMWGLRGLYWLGMRPHRLRQLYGDVR